MGSIGFNLFCATMLDIGTRDQDTVIRICFKASNILFYLSGIHIFPESLRDHCGPFLEQMIVPENYKSKIIDYKLL